MQTRLSHSEKKGNEHMKYQLKLIVPLIILLAAILTLGIRGGTASAATSTPQQHLTNAAKVSPDLSRVACEGSTITIAIASDYLDCFAGTGTLDVAIYNVGSVGTGNATGYLIWDDLHGHYHQWNFPYKNDDYYPSGVVTLPRVDVIYIS
jgi:hypothetical protein